jgi:hypothetical protein
MGKVLYTFQMVILTKENFMKINNKDLGLILGKIKTFTKATSWLTKNRGKVV